MGILSYLHISGYFICSAGEVVLTQNLAERNSLSVCLNLDVYTTICNMNWNFKIYLITNDTVKPPLRDSDTIWWSAQPTEGCRSIPEALQKQLSWCKFSLWTAHSRWGKPCHQVENRPVVLSRRQDTRYNSLPIGPPEETVRGIFNK